MRELTFGSLFAGIGGFDLGFERAGFRCLWHVEIDEYCRKVLAKHWPQVPRHDDVRTFPPTQEDWQVDVVCGGFPCQDISTAGRRAGLDGERSGLWSQMLRVVALLRPKYVVVENTAGLLAPVCQGDQAPIGRVLGELSTCGYDAEWQVIPAAAVGASHIRDRVFVVAYPQGHGDRQRVLSARPRPEGEGTGHSAREGSGVGAHSKGQRHRPNVAIRTGQEKPGGADVHFDATHAHGIASGQGATEDSDESGKRRASSESCRPYSPFVGQGWWGTEPPVVRMVHGVPRRLVRPAIHGLGNAVVPQVAEWIAKQIANAIATGEQFGAEMGKVGAL